MTRTFLDAGVLIATARGKDPVAARVTSILNNPERTFASSVFVQLEVLPKAVFNQRHTEARLYRAFFDSVKHWAVAQHICALAIEIACESGLSAMDALHVAAAVVSRSDELLTTELPSKPLYRTRRIQVLSVESVRQ